jgi:hypothetical protein
MNIIGLPQQPPSEPDRDSARLLGWLVKQGGMVEYNKCDRKSRLYNVNLKELLEKFPDKLSTPKLSSRGKTRTVVKSVDPDWADAWAKFYHVNRGHHGQIVRN